jgi:hypothetical protein
VLNLRADQLKHDVRRGQIDAILGASGPVFSSEQRVLARDVGGGRFHRRVGEVVARPVSREAPCQPEADGRFSADHAGGTTALRTHGCNSFAT